MTFLPLRTLVAVVMAVASIAATSAQLTARSAFTSAPSSLLPTLTANQRLDMLDYYDSGLDRASKDVLGTECRIDTLSANVITISIGSIRNLSFYILDSEGKKPIIMAIDRLRTPAVDSSMSFYNSKWERQADDKIISLPLLADWTGKIGDDKRERIENALPFAMYDADFDHATSQLTLSLSTDGYVAREDSALVADSLAKRLIYTFNPKKQKFFRSVTDNL